MFPPVSLLGLKEFGRLKFVQNTWAGVDGLAKKVIGNLNTSQVYVKIVWWWVQRRVWVRAWGWLVTSTPSSDRSWRSTASPPSSTWRGTWPPCSGTRSSATGTRGKDSALWVSMIIISYQWSGGVPVSEWAEDWSAGDGAHGTEHCESFLRFLWFCFPRMILLSRAGLWCCGAGVQSPGAHTTCHTILHWGGAEWDDVRAGLPHQCPPRNSGNKQPFNQVHYQKH